VIDWGIAKIQGETDMTGRTPAARRAVLGETSRGDMGQRRCS